MAGPDIVRQVPLSSNVAGTTLSGTVDATGNGGGDDLLVVIAGGSYSSGVGARNISSLLYAGVPVNRLRRITAGGGPGESENLELYVLAAPASGPNLLSGVWGATMDTRYMRAYVLSRAEQGFFQDSGVGIGASAQASLSIVDLNASANDLLIAASVFAEGAAPITFNTSGLTVDQAIDLASANDDFEGIIGHKVQPSADPNLDILFDGSAAAAWATVAIAIEGTGVTPIVFAPSAELKGQKADALALSGQASDSVDVSGQAAGAISLQGEKA